MNIKFILSGPYPNGMALTNRIHNYAKGITELGNNVHILIPSPTEKPFRKIRNENAKGIYEGVNFVYTSGKLQQANSTIGKIIIALKGTFNAGKILKKDRKTTDCVLLISNSLYHIIYFKLLTWLFKIPYIQEKSEYPFVFYKRKSLFFKIYIFFYTKLVFKCFDGIIVISKYLFNYFKPRIRKNAQLLLVPVIVNVNEFQNINKGKKSISIVYSGTLTESKDGLHTIIKAFNLICNKHSNTKLYVIGDTNNEYEKEKIKKLIDDLKLNNKVVLTGYVSRKELINYLINASVLTLAKPPSLQADSCFPSKLGEYLATGNPVVVTNVGVIPDYLRDGENAFLSEPDNIDEFAKKLDFVLSNPNIAKEAGLAGKQLANKEFNYQNQAKRIIAFIKSL